MRITFTGRRLALAAVLVLGGVTAPLAYATLANGKGAPASASRVTPNAPDRTAAKLIGASTGDNPYQLHFNTANQACGALPLPATQDFVLESATVSDVRGAAEVWIYGDLKLSATNFTDLWGLNIPVSTAILSGHQPFTLLVRPDALAAAAIGDVFGLNFCVATGGSFGPFGVLVLTGQKVAASTAAMVSDFGARSGKNGATLSWRTASETQILGFNVWRYRGAKGVKVNRSLVRAKRSGEPAGASYRFVDRVPSAKRGLTYRLQLVDLKGKRTWYAAFAIASK